MTKSLAGFFLKIILLASNLFQRNDFSFALSPAADE